MHRRIFIVHGWDGYPEEGWFPWLKKELERKGFEVHVPTMPHSENPTIDDWVVHLKNTVGELQENDYFVGHSIGCQTIMRYFQEQEGRKAGGAVFVGGWFGLSDEVNSDDESYEIAKPWYETPIDFERIKKVCNKYVAIFSDNDSLVPLENALLFKERLHAKILTEHEKGHFSGEDGVTQLPIVLKSLLELMV